MTGIRLAANLKWLFTETSLAERFDAAAGAGFAGVEVPDPYSMTPQQFNAAVRDAGVAATLINTPPGSSGTATQFGAACVPGCVEEFRTGVLRSLEYATAAGCPIVHVVGGRVPPGVSNQLGFATYVANISWASQQALDAGVVIGLEMQNQRSSPGFVLRTQVEAATVAEAIGEPVGLLFDFFHTQVAEGDVTTKFLQHLALIKHIQIGDGPARGEPGTGELSWPFIFTTIRDSGYSGWVGCEFDPHGNSTTIIDRLRRLM